MWRVYMLMYFLHWALNDVYVCILWSSFPNTHKSKGRTIFISQDVGQSCFYVRSQLIQFNTLATVYKTHFLQVCTI